MTSYFQYNDDKTKRKPQRTEHGTELVEIDGILVTEEPPEAAPDPLSGTPWSGNDRHGWHCPCVECRIDRAESDL